jgi:hypothetical protein
MKSRTAIAEPPRAARSPRSTSAVAARAAVPSVRAADDHMDTLKRLAKEAQQLDDVIQKAAQMQKRILDQIRTFGAAHVLDQQRPSKTPRPRKRARGQLE